DVSDFSAAGREKRPGRGMVDSGDVAAAGHEPSLSALERPAAAWARPIVWLSDAIDRVSEACYVATTVSFAAVMLLGVFFRYVLNNSLVWSDELALILFVWATFFSISSGYLHGAHVKVDVFVEMLPAAWQSKVSTVAVGLTGGYLLGLLASSIEAMGIAS